MGQKTNAVELRLGIQASNANWYASQNDYAQLLEQDMHARFYLEKHAADALLTDTLIERNGDVVRFIISCAKPGVITGKGGAGIQELHSGLQKYLVKKCDFKGKIKLIVKEEKKSLPHAKLIAASIAKQISSRVNPKKAMKREIERTYRVASIKGIKIIVSGRIGGADIARSEKQQIGRVPLHTLKANIQYCSTTAQTTYGIMGIKVWLFIEDNQDIKASKESQNATTS